MLTVVVSAVVVARRKQGGASGRGTERNFIKTSIVLKERPIEISPNRQLSLTRSDQFLSLETATKRSQAHLSVITHADRRQIELASLRSGTETRTSKLPIPRHHLAFRLTHV